MIARALPALLALIGTAAAGAPATIVRIETDAGTIRAALDWAAPATAANFLRYVAAHAYDGGRFFRTVHAARTATGKAPIDVIQVEAAAGEEADLFGPIRLERTRDSGLTHKAGALSMARWGPDTATSSFSIVAEDSPELDFGRRRQGDGQGFAVFGHVVSGMDVVRAIHRAPDRDERLDRPVTIRRVVVEATGRQRE